MPSDLRRQASPVPASGRALKCSQDASHRVVTTFGPNNASHSYCTECPASPTVQTGDDMTTATSTELDEPTRTMVSRLAQIAEIKADLDSEEKALKAELRQRLDLGQWTWNGRPAVSLSPNRRFSPDRAVEVLPPELLALCTATKVDGATAKKVLPPAMYAACQADAGEPVLRLL